MLSDEAFEVDASSAVGGAKDVLLKISLMKFLQSLRRRDTV
ncbi:hypothetical protein ES702_00206 [subsurface metagenome]